MRKIIIGFSTPKKFKLASALIRWFEKSDYSHIYIRMKATPNSSLNFDKVFQASHGDVNAVSFDVFQEGNKIFHEYEIEVEDSKYFEVATWLWKQLGKPYGFLQLLGIAFNIKLSNNREDRFICSELSGMVLRDYLNFDINDSLDYIGLNDIRYILEDMENKK
jgi:hypothetical protein